MRRILTILSLLLLTVMTFAQRDYNNDDFDDGFTVRDNSFNPNRALDSLDASHKEVPKGLKVWTLSKRFGDQIATSPDTVMHLFMNTVYNTGKYGEYNTTGNIAAPRISRIVTDRDFAPKNPYLEPYGYFITSPWDLRFTNTLSPLTNVSYYSCGDKTDGEDKLKVLFASNINKDAGIGFKFDYDYGRGLYQNQSIALFDYTFWGSYIGERYQAHLVLSFDHMKNTENGGITNDEYITHPEAFTDQYAANEIPVVLSDNWNRQDAFHATLTHRYNVGFYRQVPMTEMEKEAKRFAMKSQSQAEKSNGNKEESGKSGKKKDSKVFSGRPKDAAVAGDFSSDSVKLVIQRQKEELKKQMADSIAAASSKEKEDTSWMKDEYVPVTSFIHTVQFDKGDREYRAYSSPANYYLHSYTVPTEMNQNDSISDLTDYYNIENTFAIGLLEGFNKYVPMGLKVFAAHSLRHYKVPELEHQWTSYNENNVTIGAQLIRQQGQLLHYIATGELGALGEDKGDVRIDGVGDLKIKFGKRDSLNVNLKAFYHLTNPIFMQRHYHGKHFWWDNDFDKQMHTHLEGIVSLSRTRTSLRVAYDNLNKYVYLGESYDRQNSAISKFTANMHQASDNISLLTAMLEQNFKVGILNWENRFTYQSCSNEDIIPVPKLNYWTNLYLNFRIARVLSVHFGAQMTYFSKYYAPEYCPQLGQYAVQENESVKTEVGGYPFVDVYASFKLKNCRFFLMMNHVNAGMGSKEYFLTPHHPQNDGNLRFGLSWNFYN